MNRSLKLRRLALRLQKRVRALTGRLPVYMQDRSAEYRRIWQAVGTELGANFRELARDAWELELRGRKARFVETLVPVDDPVTLELAVRKPLIHQLLKEAGLTVPQHLGFQLHELDQARRFLAGHAAGCAVKPADAYGGAGVSVHVRTDKALDEASVLAAVHSENLLIEAMIPGESYRLLVYDGELIHARRRGGLRLLGDGTRSIRSLLAQRGIDLDDDIRFTLAAQGLDLDRPAAPGPVLARSVPPGGARRELRTVYDETVPLEAIHPTVRAEAEGAARALGSRMLGVDVITPDIARPLSETGGALNEVNTTPALHHHYEPDVDRFPEPALFIARRLLHG